MSISAALVTLACLLRISSPASHFVIPALELRSQSEGASRQLLLSFRPASSQVDLKEMYGDSGRVARNIRNLKNLTHLTVVVIAPNADSAAPIDLEPAIGDLVGQLLRKAKVPASGVEPWSGEDVPVLTIGVFTDSVSAAGRRYDVTASLTEKLKLARNGASVVGETWSYNFAAEPLTALSGKAKSYAELISLVRSAVSGFIQDYRAAN